MSVSEVIETYIRAHPGVTENDAFEGFARQERIAAWLGSDATRRERLRREFARVWSQMEASASAGPQRMAPPQRREDAPRLTQAPPPAPPKPLPAMPEAEPMQVPVRPSASARKLNLLCPSCESLDVWSEAGRVRCHQCGRGYDNMLELVPVQSVGPFAFLFGEGATGWLTAGGIVLLLAILYGVLKWA